MKREFQAQRPVVVRTSGVGCVYFLLGLAHLCTPDVAIAQQTKRETTEPIVPISESPIRVLCNSEKKHEWHDSKHCGTLASADQLN